MTEHCLTKQIYLRAAPEHVWAYLTDPDKLAIWFHRPAAPLREGAAFELCDPKTGDRVIWGRVIEADAPRRLEYTFTIAPLQGAETRVVWTLTPVPGGTRLSLDHSGLPQGEAAFGLILALDEGWEEHMGRMRTDLHETAA